MKIQWEKLPDRLDSEATKCLFCSIMSRVLKQTDDMVAALATCCTVMTQVLTMEEDEPFKDDGKLAAFLAKAVSPDRETAAGLVFIDKHNEYILTCVNRVLDRVRACPDKKHNKEGDQ